jgi:thiosulfate/3-mercaptopyruvate sulfurtransferase
VLVDGPWLESRLDDPDTRVFDATVHFELGDSGPRTRAGRAEYETAHVPGAGFLDVLTDLSDPAGRLAFTRPSAARLEHVLSRAGVSNDHQVVLYSAASPMWATRAWWVLRAAGHERVAILDGGLELWRAEGRSTCSEPCGYAAARFRAKPRDELWAAKDDVLAAIEAGGACTIDALPRAIHAGEAGLGYARPGHIAGSVNVPFHELLVPERGTFRTLEELRAHFAAIGALDRECVISYCGGGIAATLNAFALTLLGHPRVAVYDGSLDEWSRDPDLPMETGE